MHYRSKRPDGSLHGPPQSSPADLAADALTARGGVFGTVATRYDAIRPGYPPTLVESMLRHTHTAAGARVLEIGAGTGQATATLLSAGLNVLALEPSAAMAAILRERCAGARATGAGSLAAVGTGSLEVVESTFEAATLAPGTFDLVFAASSWHWLGERRWERALAALRPDGAIAVAWHWPLWRHTALRAELDHAYRESGAPLELIGSLLQFEPTLALLRAGWLSDLPSPDRLGAVIGEEQSWERAYTTDEYIALINTYADHAALAAPTRARIDHGVRSVIERAGGTLTLPYKTFVLAASRA